MPDLRSRFVCFENVIFSLRLQVSKENASPMLLPFKGHSDLTLTRRDTSIPHTSQVMCVRRDNCSWENPRAPFAFEESMIQ